MGGAASVPRLIGRVEVLLNPRDDPGVCWARMAIRVALAEDNLLVREGVQRLLETRKDATIQVVASCGDLESLLQAVERTQPDVVLTDIRMPPTHTDEGLQIAAQLRKTHPQVGVVLLSQFDAPVYARALLEEGSAGRAYLLKERVSDPEQLVGAIREVARGGSVIDPKVVEALVAALGEVSSGGLEATASPGSKHAGVAGPRLAEPLTEREREVLELLVEGASNQEIARQLVVSLATVKTHVNHIFAKLDAESRVQVVARARTLGLLRS
jgi:DNA-binding NarL/FixJ family response regulator